MRAPIFLDTTLRDGEQSPGVYFTHSEKLEIAWLLDQLGVNIIEAGIPSMGEEESISLKAITKLGLKAEILSWNRLLEEDVISSLNANVSNLHLSAPTSDIMLESKMSKSREWLPGQMEKVFNFAKKEGTSFSFGAEDASRTDPVYLKKIFHIAQDLGAKRVRFAVTLGIMTPSHVAEMISFLSEGLDIPIDFHGHNDFGLATANALSAWENGSDLISCSVMGLGERAGNTSLEELAGVIRYLEGGLNNFDFIGLKELCKKISTWLESPIPDRKPIIGDKIYSHESGIHVDGLLKDASTYELYSPEIMGSNRKLILGKHSGRKAVQYLADASGYMITNEQIDAFPKDISYRQARSRNIHSTIDRKSVV